MFHLVKLIIDVAKPAYDFVKPAVDFVKPLVSYVTGGITSVLNIKNVAAYNFDKDLDQKRGVKRSKSNLNLLEEGQEQEVTEEKEKMGFFGKIIDFFFGQTTLRLITIGCAAMMMMSPLGPIVGGISLGLSVLCMAYGMYKDAKHLKDLKAVQKEDRILSDILGLEVEKQQILSKALGGLDNETMRQALSDKKDQPLNKMFDPKQIALVSNLKEILDADTAKNRETMGRYQGKDRQLNVKNPLDYGPESLIPLAGNVLTLNPFLIGMGIFSTMGSIAVVAKEGQAFADQSEELMNHLRQKKDVLGLTHATGKSLDFLNEELRNQYAQNKALKNVIEKIEKSEITDTTKEGLKTAFEQEKDKILANEKEMSKVKESKVKGTLHYLWKHTKRGFSYDKSYELNSPLKNLDASKKSKEAGKIFDLKHDKVQTILREYRSEQAALTTKQAQQVHSKHVKGPRSSKPSVSYSQKRPTSWERRYSASSSDPLQKSAGGTLS